MPAPTSSPDPPPQRTRLEDEVLQILNQVDRDPTPAERLRDAGRRGRRAVSKPPALPSPMRRLGPGLWLVASLLIAGAAALVAPSSHLAGFVLGIASLACLVMVWRPTASSGGDGVRRWRGRDLGGPPRDGLR